MAGCYAECFTNVCVQLGVDEIYAEMAAKTVRKITKQVSRYSLFEDVKSTLQGIKQRGHHNLLLTNNYPDVDEVVKELGLAGYLEHYLISGLVGYSWEIFLQLHRA